MNKKEDATMTKEQQQTRCADDQGEKAGEPLLPESPVETSSDNQDQVARTATGTKRLAEGKIEGDEGVESTKKCKTGTPETSNKCSTDIVDTASALGYSDGDRLEVEWDIHVDGADDSDNVETHWWGATLLPFDGRLKEHVAIRTLEYDAHPEGGFPEKSREDVVFLDHNLLAVPENMDQLLYYRRAGSEETYGIQDVEPIVDQILQNIMQKNQQTWNHLAPAQQAEIASRIASKREKLVALLHQQTGLVTSQEMHSILAQAMTD